MQVAGMPWRAGRALVAGALAAALSGCWIFGDDVDPPAQPAALDDSATVAWRTSTDIDVLANDTVQRGTLVLEAVEAPSHGTASVVDGRLRYTPAAGWIGPDTVRYTVRADADGSTASASVQITVEATFAIGGAAPAGATVALTAGDQTLNATADAQGRYRIEITSSDAQRWLVLNASTTDSRVKLVSVVGELGALLPLVPDSGEALVDASLLSALNVDAWNTATAELMASSHGGTLPADAAALAKARSALSAVEQLQAATAVQLVLDGAAALPGGAADTTALAGSLDAVSSLLGQRATPGDDYTAVLSALPASAGSRLAVASPLTLLMATGSPVLLGGDIAVFAADGTVTIDQTGTNATDSRVTGRWTEAAGVLTVVLDTPRITELTAQYDGGGGFTTTETAQWKQTGWTTTLLGGDWRSGTARVLISGPAIYTSGPGTGSTVQNFTVTPTVVSLHDLAAAALSEADLPAGTRLAGLPVGDAGYQPSLEEIVRLDAGGVATLEIGGQTGAWSVKDGWLELKVGGSTRRHVRVSVNPLTGLETWVSEGTFSGVAGLRVESQVTPVAAGQAFTIPGAVRQWRNESAYTSTGSNNVLSLLPDGTASGTPAYTRWTLEADGSVTLVRSFNGIDYPRRWIPVRRTGDQLLVMEIADFRYAAGGTIEWRLNWYRDLGPPAGF